MKAIVYHGVQDIRYEPNWPDPRPAGPGEVKVATLWCGICGTDMEDYRPGIAIPVGQPHPVTGRMAPLVIGHEMSGRIAEIGPGVEGFQVGQRVACEPIRVCHTCFLCRQGEYSSCVNQACIGQVDDGGMAEYFLLPAENVMPLPETVSDDVAALIEPLAVMVRGVRKGQVSVGDTVTVIGAGPIGLSAIGAARAAGAARVIAITRGGKRALVAAQMGAHHVLNSKEAGWKEAFYDLTHGLGSDVVIDAGATAPAIQLAVELTRRRGRCVLNSAVGGEIPLTLHNVIVNEIEIVGTCSHSFDQETPWALQYLSDCRIDVSPLITSRIYIEDAVEQGFDRLLTDRDQIKILITPRRDFAS